MSLYSGQQCKDCPLNTCTSGNPFLDMPIMRPNINPGYLFQLVVVVLLLTFVHDFSQLGI